MMIFRLSVLEYVYTSSGVHPRRPGTLPKQASGEDKDREFRLGERDIVPLLIWTILGSHCHV